jgi:hypothetical protein
MRLENINGLMLGQFENLLKHNNHITHFVTTRHGGVSTGAYNSFNLSLNGDDNPSNVLNNRQKLADTLGLTTNDFVYPIQVHGTNTPRVYEADRGRGTQSPSNAFKDTDGFITNVPRLCLITLAADCVPIVFFDPVHKAIGVAHAGWKGTTMRVPASLVDSMSEEFGTNPKDLIVGIGPSGGPCCYEVGDDVIAEVEKSFDLNKVIKNIKGKTIFDMWEANKTTLIESGVRPANIEVSDLCTISKNETFFSARRGDDGRFVAGIFLT